MQRESPRSYSERGLYFLTSSMRHPNSYFIVYHVKKRFDCLMFFRQE